MATTFPNFAPVPHEQESLGLKIVHAAMDFFGDIGRARKAYADYERLAHMSDAELGRRGLAREDLPRIAFDRAFDKTSGKH